MSRASGSYDKCVHALRERYKDDVTNILSTLLSHSQVAKKNQVCCYCMFCAVCIS